MDCKHSIAVEGGRSFCPIYNKACDGCIAAETDDNSRHSVFMEALNTFTPDFLAEGRPDQLTQKDREPFD